MSSITRRFRVPIAGLALAGSAMFLSGCQNDAQNGALFGTMLGAGLGAVIGHQSGEAGAGAAIGAGAGALTGYIIGNESDKGRGRRCDPNYSY
jgi:hypothetical protein